MAALVITAILAFGLTVAAEAQYHLQTGLPERSYQYPQQQVSYYQPESQYESYQPAPTQPSQTVNQLYNNGARSSTTFNFGQRRVAVQVDHHASQALVNNNFGEQLVAPGYKFNSPQDGRILNQFTQRYQTQTEPSLQNGNVPSGNSAYTLTNPINGQKYAVTQPGWDQDTYNVNIHYNKQQLQQPASQLQNAHNFQFGFASQPNYFDQRNPLNQNNFILAPPTISSSGYNTGFGQTYVQSPHRGYEVNEPNQPKLSHKLVYTRPQPVSQVILNEGPQVNNAVQALADIQQFDSGKLVTKQETVKNCTVITRVDEKVVEEESFTTTTIPQVSVEHQTAPVTFEDSLPIVEDAKVKFLPTPTIHQPTITQKQNQYYESLTEVPDYSNHFRNIPLEQTTRPTQQLNQETPQNFKFILQPTPEAPRLIDSAPGTQNNFSPRIQDRNLIYQTTPSPPQQQYVFYQTSPSPQSASRTTNYVGNVPGSFEIASPINMYQQSKEKVETLLSVNGFEEAVTEAVTELSVTNANIIPLTAEQSSGGNLQETKTTAEVTNIYEQTTLSPTTIASNIQFEEKSSVPVNDNDWINRYGFFLNENPSHGRTETISSLTQTPRGFSLGQPTPTQQVTVNNVEESVSQLSNDESVFSKTQFLNTVQSTTPSYQIEVDQKSINEPHATRIDHTSDNLQNSYVSTTSDNLFSKRVKKIRLLKKPNPTTEEINEEQYLNDRSSKTLNTYNALVPNSDVQTDISQVSPDTVPTTNPQRISSRYRGNVRHRLNDNVQQTTPRSRIRMSFPRQRLLSKSTVDQKVSHDSTLTQTISPEEISTQNVVQESLRTVPQTRVRLQPSNHLTFYPTAPSRNLQRVQPETETQTLQPIIREKIPQEITQTISSHEQQHPTLIPHISQRTRERIKSTIPLRPVHPTVPVQLEDDSQPLLQTRVTTARTHSTVHHQTNKFTETSTPDQTLVFVTPTTVPETTQISQRGRSNYSQQRQSFRSSYREPNSNNVARPGTYSLNGRLRVTNPTNLETNDQPQERRQFRYQTANQPQRQVIRKIKIKMNRKTELFEHEDQNTSGSVRASYIPYKPKGSIDKHDQEQRLQNQKQRNSLLFPTRKPLTRFGLRTTEANEASDGITNDDSSNDSSTATVQKIIENVTTEKTIIQLESTTTRVTEKRQIKDDQIIQDLNNDDSYSQVDSKNLEGLQQGNLIILKEINLIKEAEHQAKINENAESLKIEEDEALEPQEDDDNQKETEDRKLDRENHEEISIKEENLGISTENPSQDNEEYLVNPELSAASPEQIMPLVNPEIKVVPSANPELSDPVTKIEIVTSISESDGQNNGESRLRKINLQQATQESITVAEVF